MKTIPKLWIISAMIAISSRVADQEITAEMNEKTLNMP
jgi:hypothetical protein